MYLLSIQEPFASHIVSGKKRWEFRANPRFGEIGDHSLASGDILFIIAMGGEEGVLIGAARVGRIIREPDFSRLFADPATGLWRQGGPAWDDFPSFVRAILGEYRTAVELDAVPLEGPVSVSCLRRASGKPWSGKGFNHVDMLRRYAVEGRTARHFLRELLPPAFHALPAGTGDV